MSYYVEYNPDVKFRYPSTVKRSKGKLVKVTLTATILLVGGFILFKTNAYKWLIPGDPDVTVPAFSGMIADFTSGVPVKEAVTNFCREIITGAS